VKDWVRMGDAIEERRKALDLTKAAVARRARISESTLYHAVHGSKRSEATYLAIERALNWPAGTLKHIGGGGDAPPEPLDDPARLRRVEERTDQHASELKALAATNARLAKKVDELTDRLAKLER